MKRSMMIRTLKQSQEQGQGPWDIIIIGGGATGLGTAVDAASRGYKTLLLEMEDFAHGTSSRSTKLIHGGVRYLEQGHIKLVLEALKERGLLLKNAPHLVHRQPFIVPFYRWWKGVYYRAGLWAYDLLSGHRNIKRSKRLSAEQAHKQIPGLNPRGLSGGIRYYDGQFDDARLAINLAQTAAGEGGTLINYMKVTGLIKEQGQVRGVHAVDRLTGETYSIQGHAVINATGVFADEILKLDNHHTEPVIKPSQGIHIVVDREFLSSDSAMMIPETTDGRVLFAIPWHDQVIIGTTDTPVEEISTEPVALSEEIDYLLEHVAEYLVKKPARKDVKSVFAGLRPLVNRNHSENTSEVSRDHSLFTSPSGLITIAGGKWTTYRLMAEEVVDRAARQGELEERDCMTEQLRIHGWETDVDPSDPLRYYGSDREAIRKLVGGNPELGERLHSQLPYLKAEVIWATRHEMAMTVEDFMARRTRALFLNAEASGEMAPEVARLMAEEAGFGKQWMEEQVNSFRQLAKAYRVPLPK